MAWIRAQLDEDELAAQEAQPGPWHIGNAVDPTQLCNVHTFPGSRGVADGLRWLDAEHIIRNDPASVLRRVEVNRLILDKHGIIWRDIGWLERDGNELIESYEELPVCVTCVPKHSHFPTRDDVPTGPCLTVRLLASTYSGRRGYRAEWAL